MFENIYIIVNTQEKYSHRMLCYRDFNICYFLPSGLLVLELFYTCDVNTIGSWNKFMAKLLSLLSLIKN